MFFLDSGRPGVFYIKWKMERFPTWCQYFLRLHPCPLLWFQVRHHNPFVSFSLSLLRSLLFSFFLSFFLSFVFFLSFSLFRFLFFSRSLFLSFPLSFSLFISLPQTHIHGKGKGFSLTITIFFHTCPMLWFQVEKYIVHENPH